MYVCNTVGNVELSGVKIAPAIGVVSCGELIKHRMKFSCGLYEVANEELKSKTNMSVKRDIVIFMCTELYGMSSYARAMIDLRGDAELKDSLMVMFGHLMDAYRKKRVSDATKNIKTIRQAVLGIQTGWKCQVVYRPKKTSTTPKKTKASKKVDEMVFEKDSESEVKEMQNEIANFRHLKFLSLTENQLAFANAFDLNLHG
ncbi:hypothetical protein Tco_0723466 [Tanacetum coccineum]